MDLKSELTHSHGGGAAGDGDLLGDVEGSLGHDGGGQDGKGSDGELHLD